jgi:hypothetical protein
MSIAAVDKDRCRSITRSSIDRVKSLQIVTLFTSRSMRAMLYGVLPFLRSGVTSEPLKDSPTLSIPLLPSFAVAQFFVGASERFPNRAYLPYALAVVFARHTD